MNTTQTFISLNHFSLHIRPSNFAVPVYTLQSLMYTSSFSSHIPSPSSPTDGCNTILDVFSHSRKVKMSVRMVRNIVFCMTSKSEGYWNNYA